jgi:hypothetical protein
MDLIVFATEVTEVTELSFSLCSLWLKRSSSKEVINVFSNTYESSRN